MNNGFDEFTKSMARSVTRRAALKNFGVGLASMAVACIGLAGKAKAQAGSCSPSGTQCSNDNQCCSGLCHAVWKQGHKEKVCF